MQVGGGSTPAEVPGLSVCTQFPECAQIGLHFAPHATHSPTPPATPATRSLQVCMGKAQLSLAHRCQRNLDLCMKSPIENNFPTNPLSTDALYNFFLVCLVFLSWWACALHTRSAFLVCGNRCGFLPWHFCFSVSDGCSRVCALLLLFQWPVFARSHVGMFVLQIKRTKKQNKTFFKCHKMEKKKHTHVFKKLECHVSMKVSFTISPVISTLTRIQTPNLFTVSLLRHLLKTSHSHFR